MQIEDLDEIISVRADFVGGMITPRTFRYRQRICRIGAINARWLDREGARPIYHFSVQVEDDTYYLSFDSGEALWRVKKVVLEG